MNHLFLFLSLFIFIFSHAESTSLKDKMIAELDVIKNVSDAKYAPRLWKKIYAGWDLDEQIDLAKMAVINHPEISVKEFQQIVRCFFNSTRDYHVGATFYSTEVAFLPFRIQGDSHGRYFLSWVHSSFASKGWHVGDEILSFNGLPIKTAVEEVKLSLLGNPESLTDQGLAEMFFTLRLGSLGHPVPKGGVSVEMKHLNGHVIQYEMAWNYVPELVSSAPYRSGAMIKRKIPKEMKSPSLLASPFFKQEMTAGFYKSLDKLYSNNLSIEDEMALIGNRKSFLPALGSIIWKSDERNSFQAYLYKNKSSQVIGFIRIPHYLPDSSQEVAHFASILKLFEAKSHGLIIDQTNNPGGELLYMYTLASMLTTHPLQVMTHRRLITQEEVFKSLLFLAEIQQLLPVSASESDDEEIFIPSSYLVDLHKAINYATLLISEWNEGHRFTDPLYLYGMDTIPPCPTGVYTKPILILVNQLALSCGDFFPAIFQDNKRATILGTRTAGAGGIVFSYSHANQFGIANYNLTGSMAERGNHDPLENLGVTPDITYEISAKDLQTGYKDYINAINKTISKLIKP